MQNKVGNNKKNVEKFYLMTSGDELNKIVNNPEENFQTRYTKWSNEIKDKESICFRKSRRPNENKTKTIQILIKNKRNHKKAMLQIRDKA